MRVLVVDDDPDVVKTLAEFLEDCGYDVVTAPDGATGLDRLEGVGLVLADVRMPGIDGLQFMRRARTLHHGLPVILMTGHGDASLAAAARREGTFDFIRKPPSLRELRSSVATVEERSELDAMIFRDFPTEEAEE